MENFEEQTYKIATVTVTYNRKESLLKNLHQLFIQNYPIEYFIIIDNCSTDGTFEYLAENKVLEDSRVKFISLSKNMGGAGGFERGVIEAFNMGVDYAYLMDDDGYPINENSISNIVKQLPIDNQIVMLNSLVICDDAHLSFEIGDNLQTVAECQQVQQDGKILNSISPFNGTLISKGLYKKIGVPNGQFFLRGDEAEYRFRAIEANAYIATILDSLYFHPAPKPGVKVKFLGRSFMVGFDAPWKEYYEMRNLTFVLRKKSKFKTWIRYIKCLTKVGLVSDKTKKEKRTLKKFIKKGYHDAKKGKLGKTVEPGQTVL